MKIIDILDAVLLMRNNNRMIIYGYVISLNHIHVPASAGDLSKEFGKMKSLTYLHENPVR